MNVLVEELVVEALRELARGRVGGREVCGGGGRGGEGGTTGAVDRPKRAQLSNCSRNAIRTSDRVSCKCRVGI